MTTPKLAALAAPLLLAAPALAGQANSELTGRVEGAPPDTRVVAECHGDPPVRRTVPVERDGRFVIDDLPPGPCRVWAEAEDHDSALDGEVVLRPGESREVRLALTPERQAPVRDYSFGMGRDGQVPLASRTLEARLQLTGAFDGDRGPWGAVMGSAGYDNGYRLDGFDITDPLAGGPGLVAPLLSVVATEVLAAAGGADNAARSGAAVDLISASGSNRLEAVAGASSLGLRGPRQVTEGEARLSGPLLKDRLWFLAAVQSTATASESNTFDWWTSAKLTWQATGRNKLTLLGLASQEQERFADDRSRAEAAGRLVGAIWESLVADTLVCRFQLGWRSRRHEADEVIDAVGGWQALARVDWFLAAAGEHTFEFGARYESLDARLAAAPEPLAGQRALLFVEDAWRPVRFFTVTAGLAHARGDFADARSQLHLAGATPHLGLAWDPTHDGRTVVRGSASASLDTGDFADARLAATEPSAQTSRTPRTWELTAGVEREISEGISLAADLVQRWRPEQLPGDPRARLHRGLLLALSKREGRLAYRASYLRQSTDGAHDAARLAVAYALGWGVSLGGTAVHGNSLGLARLAPGYTAESAGGFTAAPGGGGNRWDLAVRVSTSLLGYLVDEPIALWLDALDLLDNRAVVGERSSAEAPPIAVRAPGRQLRAGLSWAY